MSDPMFHWRIDEIERKANEANRKLHEIDSLRSDVVRLEHSIRAISTALDGIRSQFEAIAQEISHATQGATP